MAARKKWTFDIYNGERHVRWSGGDEVEVETDRRGEEPSIERFAWWDLLDWSSPQSRLLEAAIEAELLSAAARGERPEGLSELDAARWAFWRRFRPERMPSLRTSVEIPMRPDMDLWTEPSGLHRRASSGDGDARVVRWDATYFRGPVLGGLDLSFRRELRQALLDALDPGPEACCVFPLIDYERLPAREWTRGDAATRGSRTYFEGGWLVHVAWDNTGRPEGGRMEYAVEPFLTGHLQVHTPISSQDIAEILALADISPERGGRGTRSPD